MCEGFLTGKGGVLEEYGYSLSLDEAQVVQDIEDLRLFNRFYEEVIALALRGLDDILPVGERSGHDDPGPFGLRELLPVFQHSDPAERLLPVHLGHHNVETDQIIRFTRIQGETDSLDSLPSILSNTRTFANFTGTQLINGGGFCLIRLIVILIK